MKKAEETIPEKFEDDVCNIVTVARLVEQKGIQRLIKVHKKLLEDGIKHKIYVVGDGPLKPILEEEIKKLQVELSFVLLGKRENPYPYIKRADCFALFSYYEGYPMVLVEAKILGRFICITDTAARETLQDYARANIVENSEDGIYKGIKEFVERKEKYLRQNSENVVKYDNEKILYEIRNLMGD